MGLDARVAGRQGQEVQSALVDYVLADQGGMLEVEVLGEGKPLADVPVNVSLEGVELREIWAAGANSPEREAVEEAVSPVRKTDSRGIAHFDKLIPGNYQLIAAAGEASSVRSFREHWSRFDKRPLGEASGVGVRKGVLTRHRLALYDQNTLAKVQVFRADGKPMASENAAIEWSNMYGNGWSSSLQLDANGCGSHALPFT